MLKERVLTALVLLPLVLWCIFGARATQAFPLLAAVMVLIGAWEWTAMMRWSALPARAGFVALVAACLWLLDGVTLDGLAPLLLLASAFWLLALRWVTRYPAGADGWDRTPVLLPVGLLLLVPTWAGLVQLHAQSPWWLLYLFALIWGADTGAYFSGRRFGKTKLAPSVSPAKTREGLYGGLALTGLVMIGVAISRHFPAGQALLFILVSFITVLASVLGDLLESMAKRRAGIKDSGNIFPGHGGALDRLDSITSAAPVFLAGWWLVGGF